MIKIQTKEADGKFAIKMEGHAGFNPGNDIVCSAASMLIQTLHCSLLSGINGGSLKSADFSHGYAQLEFKGGQDLYHHTVLGFELLQKAYPDHVFVVKN